MATFMIIKKQLTQTMIRHSAKTPPSSSEIAAKTKSFVTTGIFSGSPCPRPSPNQPPVPIANRDWHT